MEAFLNKDGAALVLACVKAIQENRDYLSEIDGAIGDGDHGINMSKGFTKAGGKITPETDLSAALKTLGRTLLMDIGGSMGPLYGTFFIEMSKSCAGKENIGMEDFGAMLEAALAGIVNIGSAKVGDKTIMDTLVPAVQAFNAAADSKMSFADALSAMESAAEKGRDSTIDLVAKVGRASRLGERSRGVLDAGATSCCLLLFAMSGAAKALLENK